MGLFKRNPFGHILFLKKWIIRVFGFATHQRFRGFNSLQIEGSEVLRQLPDRHVLFISNHQTYFADVVAMYHVFNASLKGREDSIKNIFYIWKPKLNLYYVAASETMKAGWLPRILAYVGAVTVDRTWRSQGKELEEKREVNQDQVENIKVALDDGWVITFPQGTTKSFKPIRKGTAHIIKNYKPIVVPIVIDGFRRSFDKKGLHLKKKGILQSMVIKEPLDIDYENDTIEQIVEKVEMAIEQHPSFLKVIPEEFIEEEKVLNEKRTYKYYKKDER
ncbi:MULTISPECIES: lysophospholipid acyltransferase family protein [Myroides]|uniref:Phospholipid/glycerol acyltransferase domain-containing protein n=1 Tax=Myroides profundi TaxID=480520 RepID=A0AAJ5BDP3_MYRPR|nr:MULTISPECIES: lysophospholipid acyltransferase family protein [Myroides]AJH15933.1 1-acyl-sn-glycerol-3-phosphate acyltransferase [Myroides profundi]MCA4807261.1 1-acyl-sn-glycerol-3-phosphate acyltransferase [Myroides odoratimimus]MDM1400992.1 1-acyl-sn-glycerol-3-phosphate acyltransferase [Myroides odoratimimus]MDM1411217.1 1-acyl-sn-glycerol-3-phosphate acyltransferase [Myroides odoratimimus]MDM1464218.1 1-acyl-sn-glycerol-3-phosphate acyltransferase [Myroides odoratimimus]